MNLYYVKGDNMIQTIPVDGKPRNVNTGEIENYGAELEAQYRINSHWALSTNHSLLHMKSPVVAAPDYKGFLGADYHCNKLTVNAGLQYIGGLYTEATIQDFTIGWPGILLQVVGAYLVCKYA